MLQLCLSAYSSGTPAAYVRHIQLGILGAWCTAIACLKELHVMWTSTSIMPVLCMQIATYCWQLPASPACMMLLQSMPEQSRLHGGLVVCMQQL
jgi:hypothetical protein